MQAFPRETVIRHQRPDEPILQRPHRVIHIRPVFIPPSFCCSFRHLFIRFPRPPAGMSDAVIIA
jgi:hypothetical protein